MTPELVSELIDQARQREAISGRFREQIAERYQELHLMIQVEHPEPVSCLVRFVEDYVAMAPRLLECVSASAREIEQEAVFAPFLEAAYGAFARPSVLLSRFDGLDALLIKAYLCHRLLEEMYENNRSIRNSDLLGEVTTQANVLAHHLIGEPFANELDNGTLMRVHQLSSEDYFNLDLARFAESIRQSSGHWMRDYWQNLLTQNHISFRFSYRRRLE